MHTTADSLTAIKADDAALAAAALPSSSKRLLVYRSTSWLRTLLEALQACAVDAAAWIARVTRILEPPPSVELRVTLAAAQSALHAGKRLAMDDEHMLRLSGVCASGVSVASRAATLAHSTGRSTRGTLPTLEQCAACVADADVLPLRFDAVDSLRPIVAAAQAWEERARAALGAYTGGVVSDAVAGGDADDAVAAVGVAPPTLPPTSSAALSSTVPSSAALLEEFEGLLAETTELPLTLPLRDDLEAALQATHFEAAATRALASAQSLAAMGDLIAQGGRVAARLSVTGRAALTALSERRASAQAWIDQSGAALRARGTPLTRLRNLEAELEGLAPLAVLPAVAVNNLRERVRAAERWLEAAAPTLDAPKAQGVPLESRQRAPPVATIPKGL